MNIDAFTGLLTSANYISSPNCNQRPEAIDINLLVIHNISLPPGQFGGEDITRLFTNMLNSDAHPDYRDLEGLQVSSHLLIRRDGTAIQYVPFHQCAWHAGNSSFQGRHHCNDFSIGIELEGTDTQAYTFEQYQQLCIVSRMLMQTYPGISLDRIVGHCDIAPGRKTDPGESFDWALFRQMLIAV